MREVVEATWTWDILAEEWSERKYWEIGCCVKGFFGCLRWSCAEWKRSWTGSVSFFIVFSTSSLTFSLTFPLASSFFSLASSGILRWPWMVSLITTMTRIKQLVQSIHTRTRQMNRRGRMRSGSRLGTCIVASVCWSSWWKSNIYCGNEHYWLWTRSWCVLSLSSNHLRIPCWAITCGRLTDENSWMGKWRASCRRWCGHMTNRIVKKGHNIQTRRMRVRPMFSTSWTIS